jgi:Fe-S cluster biosynthesis and repair protein YggX
MKINILDAHDRYKHFVNQNFDIGLCCQNLIDQRPFGEHPFYIFAHTRTDDDGVTKRLIWQPRLTKPRAQTNSLLFKAYPGTDLVKIIWMIPDRAMWSQYQKGNLTENKTVCDSIDAFEHHRKKLEEREHDDLPDEKIDQIYKAISREMKQKKLLKQATSVASVSSFEEQNPSSSS